VFNKVRVETLTVDSVYVVIKFLKAETKLKYIWGFSSYCAVNTPSLIKTNQLLYREIIAVCSEIQTKHINTLCGQNVEFMNVVPGGT
jgi:Ni,Fe-hydrogenase I small subunit